MGDVTCGFEFKPVQSFVTQERAADDDGLPEVGPLLPGFKQRGASEAHAGTEPGSQPGLWKGCALNPTVLEQGLTSSVANSPTPRLVCPKC